MNNSDKTRRKHIMKKLISLIMSMAIILSMAAVPVKASEGGKVIAGFPMVKTNFYRVGGASSGNLTVKSGIATMILKSPEHRFTILENFIGENVGKGGSYRIEMDVKLSAFTANTGYTVPETATTQKVKLTMYAEGGSGEASANFTAEPKTLTLGGDAVTLSADFAYTDSFAAVPKSATVQFIYNDDQSNGSAVYYPTLDVSAIRLVEVTAPEIPAPATKTEYWKTISKVDFEDCTSDNDIKKYYNNNASYPVIYINEEATGNSYAQYTTTNQWKKYTVVNEAEKYMVTKSNHPEMGEKVKVSAKVKILPTSLSDTLNAAVGIKLDATKTNCAYQGEYVTVNKNEWTTVEYVFDFLAQYWGGFSPVMMVENTATKNTIWVDDYTVQVLSEKENDTFTFGGDPVARIFTRSEGGNIAGGSKREYPYVAKISADEIGENGIALFVTYVDGVLSGVTKKTVADAVEGVISHSTTVKSVAGAEIKIICLDGYDNIVPLCEGRGIKAE